MGSLALSPYGCRASYVDYKHTRVRTSLYAPTYTGYYRSGLMSSRYNNNNLLKCRQLPYVRLLL